MLKTESNSSDVVNTQNVDFANNSLCLDLSQRRLSDHSIKPAPAMNELDECMDEQEAEARARVRQMQIVVKNSNSSQYDNSDIS